MNDYRSLLAQLRAWGNLAYGRPKPPGDRRGGRRRRRSVLPAAVPVFVRSGRWGPRRVRVSECSDVIRAEDLYDDPQIGPAGPRLGEPFNLQTSLGSIAGILRPNTVWKFGRLFLLCPNCRRRTTRLYRPLHHLQARCRQCWGLSYQSQSWPYHGGGWARSQYYGLTLDAQQDRRQEGIVRRAERARRRRQAERAAKRKKI